MSGKTSSLLEESENLIRQAENLLLRLKSITEDLRAELLPMERPVSHLNEEETPE